MLDRLFRPCSDMKQSGQIRAAEYVRKMLGEGRLQEARRAGEEAVAADVADEDAIRALVEVYMTLESECVASGVTGYLPEITKRIDELLPQLTVNGELRERHNRAVMSSLPGYEQLAQLEQMSFSTGSEKEAYGRAAVFLREQSPDVRLIPVYGTILSRYLRVVAADGDSLEARRLLAEYLSLPVPRPSRLHSLIMRQAVRLARKFHDFKFGRFVRLWDTSTFRYEDIVDPDGKTPLAVVVFELLLDGDEIDMIPELLDRMRCNDSERLGVLRDAMSGLVNKSIQGGDMERAADLLVMYSRYDVLHSPSRRHSMMLSLAMKVFSGPREWRFPEFFINWGSENFTSEDFLPGKGRDGTPIHSLADRALKRCLNVVRRDADRYSYLLNRLLSTTDTMIKSCPGISDELFRRRRAGIISLMDREDLALEQYAGMAREEGHTSDFWCEYADLMKDRRCKAALYALGIIKGVEDVAGTARLRLMLARELHFMGLDNESCGLLDAYREYCDNCAADPMPVYGAIRGVIPEGTEPKRDNEVLYHTLAAEALDVIYEAIPARMFSVISRQGDILVVTDSTEQLEVDTRVWLHVARLLAGDNVELKCDGKDIVMVRRAGGERYGALRERYAVGLEHGTVVCGGSHDAIPCEGDVSCGDTFKVKVFRTNEGIWRAIAPERVYIVDARRYFERLCGVIYKRDDTWGFFSAGPGELSARVKLSLCEDIRDGQVVDIYYYQLDGEEPVVISVTQALHDNECGAIKSVSGVLQICPDGNRTVRDVMVPEVLCREVEGNTYVKVQAVYHPEDGVDSSSVWIAFSLSMYYD